MIKNCRSRLSNDSGFALLEVMFTAGLAVILSASLLWASLGTRHSVKMGLIYTRAEALARSYMEQIKAMDYDDVADDAVVDVVIGDNATASAVDDVSGTVTTEVTDNGDQTKTVTVTVDWTSKALGANTNRQVSLASMVSDL